MPYVAAFLTIVTLPIWGILLISYIAIGAIRIIIKEAGAILLVLLVSPFFVYEFLLMILTANRKTKDNGDVTEDL